MLLHFIQPEDYAKVQYPFFVTDNKVYFWLCFWLWMLSVQHHSESFLFDETAVFAGYMKRNIVLLTNIEVLNVVRNTAMSVKYTLSHEMISKKS